MNKVIANTMTLIVGLSLGMLLDHYLPSATQDTKQAGFGAGQKSSQASLPVAVATSARDLEQNCALIKQELARALSAKSTGGEPTATEAVAATPPKQQETFRQQEEIAEQQEETDHDQESAHQQNVEAIQEMVMHDVDILINGSIWGDEQRAQFHQKLAVLDSTQSEQAIQRLTQAIDNGSLTVTTTGPAF